VKKNDESTKLKNSHKLMQIALQPDNSFLIFYSFFILLIDEASSL